VPYCNVSVDGDIWETLYYFDQVPRTAEEVLLSVGSDGALAAFVVQIVRHVPERLPHEQPLTILVIKEKPADVGRT
jgi:hypothetical protein